MSITKTTQSPVLSVSKSWDLRGSEIAFGTVYNLSMAKMVNVQVRGAEKPLQIRADKVEVFQEMGGAPKMLKLTLNDAPIGEFKDAMVDGWWIEE